MNLDEIRKHAFLVPIFSVRDLQASLRFYTDVLLFDKRWEWGDPPDYACVALGDAELFLCQDGQGQPGTWLYLFIDGIDEYCEAIRKRGADIVSGPADEPWGMREIHVRDPDGHVLRVGTSLERKQR
jgi:catechol 2,3-dioxygenase-like lactoylglutathione lyase family enzyme